jgi:hypothetical protein
MAEAIADAYIAEWRNKMGNGNAPIITEQMKLLCVAIARGVIEHICANPNAFHFTVTTDDGEVSGTLSIIDGEK